MTTSQAQQLGIMDAQAGEMCLPEAYTCNHFGIQAYAEGYSYIDPDNWTARQILGIADDAPAVDDEIPGVAESTPYF